MQTPIKRLSRSLAARQLERGSLALAPILVLLSATCLFAQTSEGTRKAPTVQPEKQEPSTFRVAEVLSKRAGLGFSKTKRRESLNCLVKVSGYDSARDSN